ncbi:MAG: hypothetical protein GF408_04880 [Candidatus Omnitrophica bacterium]|nr:hypothetical protein [Candidatus Omnitrophota bacterium]
MYKGPERRKYKRIRKRYIMRFSVRPHTEEDEGSRWDMVALVDIGAGGALFYYNEKIEKDSILDLKINFAPERDPIECTAQVVRVEELEYSYMFLVAVNFQDISDEDKLMLIDAAEQFYSRKPRSLED